MRGQHSNYATWSRRARGLTAAGAAAFLVTTGLAGPALADDVPPSADVLDVDFSGGAVVDHARGIEPQIMGDPDVAVDEPLDRYAVSNDGIEDSLHYDMADQYDVIADAVSVECVFRYDGDLDANERSLCGAKEAGGFATVFYGDELTFTINVGGGYQRAAIEAEPGRWYHTLGVWDGEEVKLYVDGELVDSGPATGDFLEPQQEATNLVIAGDSGPGGSLQFPAEATISTARVFSEGLDADAAQALYLDSGLPDGKDLVLTDTSPTTQEHLLAATEFTVDFEDEAVLSRDISYTLDGEPIQPGDIIGPGLSAGDHLIEIDIVDVFGRDFSSQVEFTSGNIPEPDGTGTRHGDGSALLSATATNPSGDRLDTEFTEGVVTVADGGFQGTVQDLPTTLVFEYEDSEELSGPVRPGDGELLESSVTGGLPFQRFDVDVSADAVVDDLQIVWSGTTDPARSVHLMAWDLAEEQWTELASGRGLTDGQLSLAGEVTENHLAEGQVHAMVLGYDPMADDLDEPVRDSFEDPEDYDFAIAHLTDTQYLMEGAVSRETPEEREVWRAGYEEIVQWIADNHEERDIAYAAHTGDIIETWHRPENNDNPEGYAQARAEFEVASEIHEILDASGLPNGVLPGNHDNLRGNDNGPDSLYNEFFGPERYEEQAQQDSWQEAGASYHPWRPGDNDNHYDLFTAGGLDFIALHLGYDVVDEEVTWANEVLEQYADRNALIFTHAYNKPSANPDGRGGSWSHDGHTILEGVIENHSNVAMVMSGHEHGVSIVVRRDVQSVGNHVVELLADYQFYEVGSDELGLTDIGDYDGDTPLRFGASFFRMLQFDVEAGEVSVDTYSPLLDNFGATEYDDRGRYDGTEDDFRLPVQLETRRTSFATDALALLSPTDELIGAAQARSGYRASTTWSGLQDGEVYAWFATSSDAGDDDEPGRTRQFEVFTARGGADAAEAVLGNDAGALTSTDHPSGLEEVHSILSAELARTG